MGLGVMGLGVMGVGVLKFRSPDRGATAKTKPLRLDGIGSGPCRVNSEFG